MKLFILSIVLIFAAASVSSAQSKEVTEAELNAILEAAKEKLKTITHRETGIIQEFNGNSKVTSATFRTIREFVPPDRRHFVWIKEGDGESSQSETIYIAGRRYDKGVEGWKEIDQKSDITPSGSGTGKLIKPDIKVRVLRERGKILDGVQREYFVSQRDTTLTVSGIVRKSYAVSRYWFNLDGTLARMETENSAAYSPTVRQETLSYEYDPKIVIEAPVK